MGRGGGRGRHGNLSYSVLRTIGASIEDGGCYNTMRHTYYGIVPTNTHAGTAYIVVGALFTYIVRLMIAPHHQTKVGDSGSWIWDEMKGLDKHLRGPSWGDAASSISLAWARWLGRRGLVGYTLRRLCPPEVPGSSGRRGCCDRRVCVSVRCVGANDCVLTQ